MKNTIILTAIITVLLASCRKDRIRVKGSGPVVIQERSATAFDELKLQNSVKVIWHSSAEPRIEIEAQKNIADVLITEQKGACIVIKYKNFTTIKSSGDIIVHLYSENAKDIRVSGSGMVELEQDLDASDLTMKVSGSGKIISSVLNANLVETNISGSGRIILNDGAIGEKLISNISGSGRLEAFSKEFKSAEVDISGSGRSEVFVQDRLEVRISGSGKVTYKGNPSLDSKISGSGKVVKL
jgi:hypothetical protein